MAADAKVTLHLDLNTSEAQRKQDNFISQNKNLKASLALDISQAVQNFQDFATQIQNQAVRAKLMLDSTEQPELSVKFSTQDAETAFRNFVSGIRNQSISTVLKLDTSQAMQNFQAFVNQAKTTPVNTVLKLENRQQQTVTALKLETEQAKTAFQNFVSHVKNQAVTANLKLNLSQARADIQRLSGRNITANLNYKIQKNAAVLLHLDTSAANRKLDLFLQRIKSANPVLRLRFDVDSARSRFDSFRNHVQRTRFDSRLNLNTSDAQRSLTELLNRISNANLNLKNSGQSMNNLNGTAQNLGNTLKSLFATGAVIAWGKACISAATGTENAFRGLQSILTGQGRDFGQAQGFIQEYIADGLIPLQNAVTAYKNLAARGYSDTQIQNVLTALKDSAAYGRQASYSLGDAVTSATEGLKNENSILVDNAGVTKNVAKMWQDYAKSIGTTSANLTQAQKIQAEVNGILEETRFQSGDAAKIADSFSGKISRLTASLNTLKTAVGNILTGALSPLISYLTEGVQKAAELTEALGRMLGFTGFTADISGFSSGITSAVTKTDNLTESIETAQKAAENLGAASFDDFNIIGVPDTDTESDSDSATEEPEITPVLNPSGMQQGISEIEQQFSETLKNLFQPFRNAWENYGQPFLDSAKNAGNQIRKLFGEIGKSFAEVWTNGTGEKAVSSVLQIFRNIYDIIGNIAERFSLAWSDGTGTSIVQHLADIFQNVLDTVNHITAKTAEFAGQIDFSPLLTSVDGLLESLEPFTEHIGEGLEWFWEHVLLPVAGFTIENLIPDFLNILSGAIEILDASIAALKPFGLWLWDEFIKPLADWSGDIITTGLENLAEVLHNIGDWIRENPEASVRIAGFTAAITGLVLAVTKGAFAAMAGKIATFAGKLMALDVTAGILIAGFASWGYAITELSKNWTDICDVFEESGGTFGFISGWLEYVRDDVEEFFSFGDFGAKWLHLFENAGSVVYDFIHGVSEDSDSELQTMNAGITGFSAEAAENFKSVWDGFQENFQTGCDMITGFFTGTIPEKWNALKEDFRLGCEMITGFFSGLGDSIKEKLAGAWDAVKGIFSSGGAVFENIQNGIAETFRGIVNSLIDGINRIIYEPFDNIAYVLELLRNWEFMGGYPFEWLPEISIPEIPHLAKGGVVYQPTLAMVGDNPGAQHDPEIVSPLSKLKNLLPEQNHPDTRILESKLDTLIQLAEILIDTIAENQPVLQIGDKEIYAASERGRRKFEKMKGVR